MYPSPGNRIIRFVGERRNGGIHELLLSFLRVATRVTFRILLIILIGKYPEFTKGCTSLFYRMYVWRRDFVFFSAGDLELYEWNFVNLSKDIARMFSFEIVLIILTEEYSEFPKIYTG